MLLTNHLRVSHYQKIPYILARRVDVSAEKLAAKSLFFFLCEAFLLTVFTVIFYFDNVQKRQHCHSCTPRDAAMDAFPIPFLFS